MIDSHCHLQVDALRPHAEALLREARDAGVSDLLVPGILPRDAARDVGLAASLDVWCSVGCHPCHCDEWDPSALEPWLTHPRVVAIGECGLDFYHKPYDAVLQERVFREQIRIAANAHLPLILHNRDSDRDMERILRDAGASRGVFHCFGGDRRCLEAALDLGFHVSFAGNVTYPKAAFRELVKDVPRDRILVETDAPWLAPLPERGKTNRPALVAKVLHEIATLRGEDPRMLDQAVTDNFRACFPKASRPPDFALGTLPSRGRDFPGDGIRTEPTGEGLSS